MRITTVFRKFLRVESLYVEEVALASEGLYLHVRPSWKRPRCGECGKKASGYDRQPLRSWRHLSWGRAVVRLLYAPRRVECPKCGVRTEKVPWAEGNSRFTPKSPSEYDTSAVARIWFLPERASSSQPRTLLVPPT